MEAAPPNTPQPQATPITTRANITSADEALLTDWLDGSTPLTDLCKRHNITLLELAAWSRRPDIAELIQTLRTMHEARIKSQVAIAADDALKALLKIALTNEPSPNQEIARRAAASILRLDATLTQPRRALPDTNSTHHTPTSNTPAPTSRRTTPATPDQSAHQTLTPAHSTNPTRRPQTALSRQTKLHAANRPTATNPANLIDSIDSIDSINSISPSTKPPRQVRRPPRPT